MRLSTRTRLTLFFSSLFGGLLMLSLMFLYFRVARSLEKDFRREMIHDGRIFAELFKEELKLNALPEFIEEIKEFGVELKILDENGSPTVTSEGWGKTNIVITNEKHIATYEQTSTENIRIDNKPVALFHRPIHVPGHGRYTLHLLRSREALVSIKNKILFWTVIIAPLMIFLSAVAGYFFSKRTLDAEEEAHRRLKTFTADAAHELKIPLTSLRGHLEVALRKNRSVDEYKETLQGALLEAEHLSGLTQDLLFLAQTDAAHLKLNKQKVPVARFLSDLFLIIRDLPDEKNIHKILGSVPNEEAVFDPERLQQVLLNLVDNAIKYGKPNGTVTVSAHFQDGRLSLVVQDDGVGIPKNDLPLIFDRFYRVDKARSREQGGSGLGLSIAQQIVRAHGGEIDVVSEEGKGTTFTLTV